MTTVTSCKMLGLLPACSFLGPWLHCAGDSFVSSAGSLFGQFRVQFEGCDRSLRTCGPILCCYILTFYYCYSVSETASAKEHLARSTKPSIGVQEKLLLSSRSSSEIYPRVNSA